MNNYGGSEYLMAYKRIYDTNIKKLGITGIALIFSIFIYLSNTGDITITGYSGDMKCAGTIQEPCYAFLNFTANKDIYIYPTNDATWAFNVAPEHLMKEIIMQRSWGTGWRTIDLSKTYTKDVKYAIKFSNGQKYSLRFIGYKNNINDTVEWAFGEKSLFNNDSFIDPKWEGYSTDDFIPELIYNRADLTGGEAIFKYCNPATYDIDYDKNKINFLFNKVKGDFNTFEVSIGTIKNITRNITDYYFKIISLPTGHYVTKNDSIYFVNDSYKTEWNEIRTITETVIEYELLPSTAKKVKPNECKNIMIKGTWDAGKEISIDWIPEITISDIKFKQDKWAWWNSSWLYVRPITLTGNSSAMVDYQVFINITNTTNMNSTGQDVRFTYDDNSTVLYYWIENNTQASWFGVWVKTNQTLMNMWYGNPSAVNTSNGITTFPFFDDFAGTSLDTNKWTINAVNTITYSVNNYFRVTDATTGTWATFAQLGSQHQAKWSPTTNFSVEYKSTINNTVGAAMGQGGIGLMNASSNYTLISGAQSDGHGVSILNQIAGSNGTADIITNMISDVTLNVRYFKLVKIGTTYQSWYRNTTTQNWVSWINGTSGSTPVLALIAGRSTNAYPTYTQVENLIVKQYMATPPTVTIGDVEFQPLNITLYLNGTSADRFYELGDPINITGCADVAGTTVFINTTHPSFTNPIINGTNCATYLWNTSTAVINQFNNTETSQNHTTNNMSGVTIYTVTDLLGGNMYLRGFSVSKYDNATTYTWTNSTGRITNGANIFDKDITTYGVGTADNADVNFTQDVNYLSGLVTNYFNVSVYVGCGSGYTGNMNFYAYNTSSGNYEEITGGTWTIPATPAIINKNQTYGTNYFNNGILKLKYRLFCPTSSPNFNIYEAWVTLNYTDLYSFNLSIDIGNDNIKDYWLPYMTLQDTYAITNRFKTNTLTKSLLFSRGGTNVTYIQAPCNSQANPLSWNVSGGIGTQNLNKVDGLAQESLVFSTENSSNTFKLYIPKSSTVFSEPANITLTGTSYYESNGTLSGGYSGYNYIEGSAYKTTASNYYGSGTVTLTGSVLYCEYGCSLPAGTLTNTLVGTSGVKGSCSTTVPLNWGSGYGPWECAATISGIQPFENIWVTSTYTAGGTEPCCNACSGIGAFEKCTSFSGLNQYNIHNATNTTIWYNGTILNYQYLPELNSSVSLKVNLSSTNMNSYLSTCAQDPCPVPYTMKTTKRGNVTISGVNVDYTNSISNITFDVANDGVIDASISGSTIPNNNITIGLTGLNAMNTYISSHCVNNSVSIPIVATSQTAGTMALSNLVGNFSINPINLNVSVLNNYITMIRPNSQTNGSENITDRNKGDTTTYAVVERGITYNFTFKTRPSKIYYSFSETQNDGGRIFYVEIYNYSSLTWDVLYSLNGDINLTYFSNDTSSINYWDGDSSKIRMYVPGGIGVGYTWANVYDLYIDIMNSDIQVPIKYTADNWGILNTYSLAISAMTDYNYTFTGWADASNNMTKTVKLIWSNYSKVFAAKTKEPIFIAKLNQTQNITPYGQTTTIPAVNFSYGAREQCMNILLYTNTSLNPCMNLTISNTSNKANGSLFTTAHTPFIYNFCSGNQGLWLFWDKNASCPQQSRPYITYESKCVNCI